MSVRSFARAARLDFGKSTRSDGASRKDPHMTICASCGRGAQDHDRHVRFRLPDPVLATDEQDRVDGAWQSGPDSMTSVMMEIPAHGAFVRALLPVRLTGGFTVTYGLWVGIRPEDLQCLRGLVGTRVRRSSTHRPIGERGETVGPPRGPRRAGGSQRGRDPVLRVERRPSTASGPIPTVAPRPRTGHSAVRWLSRPLIGMSGRRPR
jgi:hypothetical protein